MEKLANISAFESLQSQVNGQALSEIGVFNANYQELTEPAYVQFYDSYGEFNTALSQVYDKLNRLETISNDLAADGVFAERPRLLQPFNDFLQKVSETADYYNRLAGASGNGIIDDWKSNAYYGSWQDGIAQIASICPEAAHWDIGTEVGDWDRHVSGWARKCADATNGYVARMNGYVRELQQLSDDADKRITRYSRILDEVR